jgi:hypothetical protein
MIESQKRTLISMPGRLQKPEIVVGHLVHTIYLRRKAERIRA